MKTALDLAALAVGVAMLVVTVYLIATYGVALFLGTPLVMGAVAGFLFNRPLSRSRALTTGLGAVVMVAAAVIMLAFALEGLICIAMAAPIVMPLGIVGALLGKAVADATSISPGGVVPLVIVLPLLAGGALGAVVGQRLAPHLSDRRLRQGFSILLIGSALMSGLEAWKRQPPAEREAQARRQAPALLSTTPSHRS